MKQIYLFVLILVMGSASFADEKDPVAVDDYTQTLAMRLIEIRVLENDYSYENNPVRIISVTGTINGSFTFNDSVIYYTPKKYFRGIDSLRYRIRDLENGLFSNFAKVFINVENNGFDFIDLNQVNCRINADGMQFTDGRGNATFEVPKGSGLMSIDSKTIWIGGFNTENNELHFAGDIYRFSNFIDFYSGPITDSAFIDIDFDIKWNRVWKLSRQEIDNHRNNWGQPGYEPIENIKKWPGNGNVEIGQAANIAPYYDWDGDGYYDPLQGDFPLIKGDQSVYLVYNDGRPHLSSGGKPLGIEIHAQYFAYDNPDDSAVSYTTFGKIDIINRSSFNYYNLILAFHVTYWLGFAYDDFMGCDTVLNSAYVYNSQPIDGSGDESTYGNHPPAQAFTLLNREMHGFMTFGFASPTVPYQVTPSNSNEYYNYMNCFWLDSSHLTYGGNGWGGSQNVNHFFSGNPHIGEGWNDALDFSPEWYRRGLIITEPQDFYSGDTLTLDFALVFARDYYGDNLSSVALLKERIHDVRDFYQESSGVEQIATKPLTMSIFPNPFSDVLYLKTGLTDDIIFWSVYDVLGNLICSEKVRNEQILSLKLGHLKAGCYFLTLSNEKSQWKQKIMKTK